MATESRSSCISSVSSYHTELIRLSQKLENVGSSWSNALGEGIGICTSGQARMNTEQQQGAWWLAKTLQMLTRTVTLMHSDYVKLYSLNYLLSRSAELFPEVGNDTLEIAGNMLLRSRCPCFHSLPEMKESGKIWSLQSSAVCHAKQ